MTTPTGEQAKAETSIASEVRAKIDSALLHFGHAEDASAVGVKLHDGTLTLSGQLHSREELQAVLNAAHGTPGVKEVINNIFIRSPLERDANDNFMNIGKKIFY